MKAKYYHFQIISWCLSDVGLTFSEISHTSTDTEDESKDMCDDFTVSDVGIRYRHNEDCDIEDVSVIDSSREVCTGEENTVEIIKGPMWDNRKLFPPGPKC